MGVNWGFNKEHGKQEFADFNRDHGIMRGQLSAAWGSERKKFLPTVGGVSRILNHWAGRRCGC